MSDSSDASTKWNARYAYSGAPVPAPASFLSQGARWLPTASVTDTTGLRALDLACGRAGNGQWLAERGFCVSAWDISTTVIDELQRRKPQLLQDVQVRDVSQHPPPPNSFDVIVVSKFLQRSLCPAIQSALKPQGVLYYETFITGLRNPDYLLEPNELTRLFSDLQVLHYQEIASGDDRNIMASLVARCP